MTTAQRTPVQDSAAKVNQEVEVGEDLSFQRSWWRFERIAWSLFTLIIVLDLAGAFGRGPLAHAQTASADHALRLRYDRIQRTGTPSIMAIELDAAAIREGEITLFLSDKLVSGLGAQRIIPQPAATRVGAGGLTYTFPASTPPAVVRIELQPPAPGIFPFRLSAGADAGVNGRIWVMP